MADVLETTQQVVLSVRIKGDSTGPQTGDVVLSGGILADFDPNATYLQNEFIVYNGAIYRAEETIDPGPFNPDQWEGLTDVTIYLRNFQEDHEYSAGEMVYYNNHMFRAKFDFTSTNTFDLNDWEPIDSVNTIIENFAENSDYSKNEMVMWDGKIYRAKEAFVSGNIFKLPDWELLSDTIILDFQPHTDYTKGNIIVVAGTIYRAKEDFTSGANFSTDDWETLASSGISGFEANKFYAQGSVITANNELYLAKEDFTSTTNFDPNDWQKVAATTIKSFQTNTKYDKGEVVYYNGQIYAANKDLLSGDHIDLDDWDLLTATTVPQFKENTTYLEGSLTYYDGYLWYAKTDFTSTGTFNPGDWSQLGINNLQTVYDYSSNGFTNPTIISPTQDFEERIQAPETESSINTMTQHTASGDILTQEQEVGELKATLQTLENRGAGLLNSKLSLDYKGAQTALELSEVDSETDASLTLLGEDGEEFSLHAKGNNSSALITEHLKKAITDQLCVTSETQKGVSKVDGETIRADGDIISSYPIIRSFEENKDYKEGELIRYKNQTYRATSAFTSGTVFNLSNWKPIKDTTRIYKANEAYSVGDLVYVQERDGLYYLRVALADISSAPSTLSETDWGRVGTDAADVSFTLSNNEVIQNNTVDGALRDLDYTLGLSVQPMDEMTHYVVTSQPAGSTPPPAISGKKIICFYTE